MKRAVMSALALSLCAFTSGSAQQERLAGDWRGYWVRAGDSMLVTMRVQRDPGSGSYTATFDAERLRVSGIPFARMQVQGCCDVTQEVQSDRTSLIFTGRLTGDSLTGTFREESREGRFRYVRVPAAAPLFEERAVTFANGR